MFDHNSRSQFTAQVAELAESVKSKPLVLLRDTERSLRTRTLDIVMPFLPDAVATRLEEADWIAEESLEQLAKIDLAEITDLELYPVRIRAGLVLIGFGALSIAFLLLYLHMLHPNLATAEQIRAYWYQYVWFVSLGVAGLFMLGREAMRTAFLSNRSSDGSI